MSEGSRIIDRLLEKVKGDEDCLEFLEALILKINRISYENEQLRKRVRNLNTLQKRRVHFKD